MRANEVALEQYRWIRVGIELWCPGGVFSSAPHRRCTDSIELRPTQHSFRELELFCEKAKKEARLISFFLVEEVRAIHLIRLANFPIPERALNPLGSNYLIWSWHIVGGFKSNFVYIFLKVDTEQLALKPVSLRGDFIRVLPPFSYFSSIVGVHDAHSASSVRRYIDVSFKNEGLLTSHNSSQP